MRVTYDKLVRDRIPEIIETSGKTSVTRVLSDAEYRSALKKKLREELTEYETDGTPEELADLIEVVYALAEAEGTPRDALERMRAEKAAARGAFREKILLIAVEDKR